MILWIIKLLNTVRQAIAGRKYPHQMAWAVALGLLLGIVPHGNLLAVIVLIVVLSLKINHAMAGLTAIATTFIATALDPVSHKVGDFVLAQPQVHEAAVKAWQFPLVPWTDLNNTVVMGSFLIGMGALIPVFVITYPVFRLFRPEIDDHASATDGSVSSRQHMDRRQVSAVGDEPTSDSSHFDDNAHEVLLMDPGHVGAPSPHRRPAKTPLQQSTPITDESTAQELTQEQVKQIAVETRIDVIRMSDHRSIDSGRRRDPSAAGTDVEDNQPMDEALNYLLRQLRDSQQRKAA